MSDWYARVETADGIHLYPLPEDQELDDLLAQLRERHGIPDDWADHPDRGSPVTRMPDGTLTRPAGKAWDVAVISGPLHPDLIAMATVHE